MIRLIFAFFICINAEPVFQYDVSAALSRGTAYSVPNIQSALDYASKYAIEPNHICGKGYENKEGGTYTYFGMGICGYPSHGGDCANFVSQVLLAGGNGLLTGKNFNHGAEVGVYKLKKALTEKHGWKTTGCAHNCKVPSNLRKGDVVLYSTSCSARPGHSAVVINVDNNGMAYVAGHSPELYNVKYIYFWNSKPACEFLYKP